MGKVKRETERLVESARERLDAALAGPTPAEHAAGVEAIRAGDRDGIRRYMDRANLTDKQVRFVALLLDEHDRLLREAEEAEALARRFEEFRAQLEMLNRFSPPTVDEAVEYGKKLAEVRRDAQRAHTAIGEAQNLRTAAETLEGFFPEAFGKPPGTYLYGIPTESVENFAREMLGCSPAEWRDPPKPEAPPAQPRRRIVAG